MGWMGAGREGHHCLDWTVASVAPDWGQGADSMHAVIAQSGKCRWSTEQKGWSASLELGKAKAVFRWPLIRLSRMGVCLHVVQWKVG